MSDEKNESRKARATQRAAEGVMATSNPPANPDRTKPERATPDRVAPDRVTKAPPAQDRWFDTQLSRMYADLAADPLPKEMMALLEKLKKSEQ